MRGRGTYLALGLAAAMAATGCHTARHAARTPQDAPGATEPTAARERQVVGFEATVEGMAVDGQLRIVEDSALWLSVSRLVELGRGLATRDSVWISAPLADISFAGTYADLSRKAGRTVSFEQLQQTALADDAGERLGRLAAELGFRADIRITSRRTAAGLALPFRKPKTTKQTNN